MPVGRGHGARGPLDRRPCSWSKPTARSFRAPSLLRRSLARGAPTTDAHAAPQQPCLQLQRHSMAPTSVVGRSRQPASRLRTAAHSVLHSAIVAGILRRSNSAAQRVVASGGRALEGRQLCTAARRRGTVRQHQHQQRRAAARQPPLHIASKQRQRHGRQRLFAAAPAVGMLAEEPAGRATLVNSYFPLTWTVA